MSKTKVVFASFIASGFILLSGCGTTGSTAPSPGTPSYASSQCPLTKGEVSQIRQQAEAGDVEAQFQMGAWYESHCGGYNNSIAAEWYERAAGHGHREAQYRIATMYFYSKGVAKNMDRAKTWYRRAAEQGDAVAARMLGDIYYHDEDLDKAEKWYRLAVEQGDARSQRQLDKTIALKPEQIALEKERQRKRKEREMEQRRREAQPYAQKAIARFGLVSVSVIEEEESKRVRAEARRKLESLPEPPKQSEGISGGEMLAASVHPEMLVTFGPYSPIVVLMAVIAEEAEEGFRDWKSSRKEKAKIMPAIATLTETFAQANPEKDLMAELQATAVRQQAPSLLVSDSENMAGNAPHRLVVQLEQLQIFHARSSRRMGHLWVATEVKLSGQQGDDDTLEKRICYMSSNFDLLEVAENPTVEFREQLNRAYRSLSSQILSEVLGLIPDPDAPLKGVKGCESAPVPIKVAGGHYNGETKDGKRHGYGEMRYKHGMVYIYKGKFVNDKESGDGRCRARLSGNWWNCTFANGKLVRN